MTEEEESELKKNQQQIDNEKAIASSIPPKLTCPFIEHGIHIIKDAVLVPCCGHFICCDECIREKISLEVLVECPIKECGLEIDSLESIISHHEMRNMVNEYLNDVKLNKFNNNYNKKSSKNDDLFIDLYLNDEFNTINPNSLTTVVNPDICKKPNLEIFEVSKKEESNKHSKNINVTDTEIRAHNDIRGKQIHYRSNDVIFPNRNHSSVYYYQASHYSTNPVTMYNSIYDYNNNCNSIYNHSGVPQTYISSLPMSNQNSSLRKHLSEQEFYEMKKRLLKQE